MKNPNIIFPFQTRREEYLSSNQYKKTAQLKLEVLSHYSKDGECKCVRCGFGDIRALSIDHINGGGHHHRIAVLKGKVSFYPWLKDNNYPSGYQTLCMNCQFIKRFEGNENSVDNKDRARRLGYY